MRIALDQISDLPLWLSQFFMLNKCWNQIWVAHVRLNIYILYISIGSHHKQRSMQSSLLGVSFLANQIETSNFVIFLELFDFVLLFRCGYRNGNLVVIVVQKNYWCDSKYSQPTQRNSAEIVFSSTFLYERRSVTIIVWLWHRPSSCPKFVLSSKFHEYTRIQWQKLFFDKSDKIESPVNLDVLIA